MERNLQLSHGPEDRKKGMQAASQVGLEAALKDVAATIRHAARTLGDTKVGVVGFCWGGILAWLAATRRQPDAAVGEIDTIRRQHPSTPVFLYDAGHGLNCDQLESYGPRSAGLARQRTLEFLRQHLHTPHP